MTKSFGDVAAEAGLDVKTPEEMSDLAHDESGELRYLSAGIEFLDRNSQTAKAMTYPITRIVLHSRMHEGNPYGLPWRTFVVSNDGETWIEIRG